MWPAFHEDGGWFANPAEHKQFVERLKHLAYYMRGLDNEIDYIHYDFLWDVPHTDRMNRRFHSFELRLGDTDKPALAPTAVPSPAV